jgi:ABC-type sugar transport system ATPase subunit
MAKVRVVNVEKRYDTGGVAAVDGLSLEIPHGEFFVLLGPSGCGKSTLLKLIAGLEPPSSGELYLDDDLVNYRPPGDLNVAMVFQNYALYPHMTVYENVRFPLKMRRTPRDEAERAIDDAFRLVRLDELRDRPVAQLSGGQRQRVALARAIVREPRVMLMDEPLSNLDALLRVQTREELLKLHRAVGQTWVYVTHDQVEAMTMGDRIGIMNDGRLVQVGTPSEVYETPADRFVARFVGSPPMSLLDGELVGGEAAHTFRADGLDVELPARIRSALETKAASRAPYTLGARPEAVELAPPPPDDRLVWTVDMVESLGADELVVLRRGDTTLRARVARAARPRTGDRVGARVASTDAHLFDAAGSNVVLAAAGATAVPA